ncbi:hypothetical protein AGOR_G00102640 [Albula goreensis]|uniref:Uncharacterized protein n=1 Tax=Albula goreensis TaxID=1534307 RepID=A0A8T3DGW7_9TELE|nr:hypothetical protein AGOR_G00102640 [Albula goreensis]
MRKKTADDDNMEKKAEEKIKAIYGIEGLRKSYSELVGCKHFPEVPKTCMKTLVFDTAKELSQNIGCYIRSDKKSEQQFWPLVKRVTIYLPNSPALLEGIVLVDLPGAGDANKHRDEMWKECLSLCSSVWIVNDINRVLSEKEYETLEKQACVRFRNDIAKDEINSIFKEKAKKLLAGDEGNSDDFFDVYTKGAMTAQKDCLENARKNVLEPTWKDNRGHHRTLKALCRKDGFFRSSNGNTIDLNHALSEPMYKNMNDTFLRTFGSGGSRSSIKGKLESFQENFITDELLKSYRKEEKRYLRLVYIRTEQRKLWKHLEKYLIEKKKLIYNAISDSIRDTIKPTYQECTEIHGKCAFIEIQKKLKDQIELSKNDMFRKAMEKMLKEFSRLQKHLVHEIETQMRTSLRVALHQIPDDLTDLPDVSEEIEMMQRCCDSLELRVF